MQNDLKDETPSSLLPTNEWLEMQSDLFRKLQSKIASIRHAITYEYESTDLPDTNDDTVWLEYCQHKEPLLRTMLHIHQRSLEFLVEMQSIWLIDDIEWYLNNRHWISQWIYSSLVCLRLPLEGSVLNSLRQIVKTCIRLRNQLNRDHVDCAIPLNLIVCIVTRNFNQLDLKGKSQ